MLNYWRVLEIGDESFRLVLMLSLTGLDGSLWLISRLTELAEVFALAM
jgi:hypothetical protein